MVVFLLIGIFVVSSNNLFAQTSSIDIGLSWLLNNQDATGFWGNPVRTSFRDTCTVVDTLSYLKSTNSTNYSSGVRWILNRDVVNIDSLTRRILSLSLSGNTIMDDIPTLVSLKNPDGGWGLYYGHKSDPLTTALALQSLKAVNYPDQNVISSAITYLTSTQKPDGGWAFRQAQGDETYESNVYMTALVLNTLSQFKSTYNLQSPIINAVAYLLTKQNPDGGFGSSPSTVYETSLVFEALIASGTVGADKATNIQNAINYLTVTQLPNGSWDDDPYSMLSILRNL